MQNDFVAENKIEEWKLDFMEAYTAVYDSAEELIERHSWSKGIFKSFFRNEKMRYKSHLIVNMINA